MDQFHPHLAALQKARDANASSRINGGDAVHPGPSGQLLMAWAILKGLHAPSLVSAATLDAGGRSRAHENCEISQVKRTTKGIAFTRADAALPFWIPPQARPILQWDPIVADLDQYPLTVTGLPEGSYDLLIDDREVRHRLRGGPHEGLQHGPSYRRAHRQAGEGGL